MNSDISIFAIASLLIIFIALLIGAYTDIKTRTCPKKIWYIAAPIAAVTTIGWYVQTLTSPDIYGINLGLALGAFITSIILCIFCVFMGYKMGNGGDWRSLFCVSLLTPWVAPATLFLSCVFGAGQVLAAIIRHRKVPGAWNTTVPWMVGITFAFITASIAYFFI